MEERGFERAIQEFLERLGIGGGNPEPAPAPDAVVHWPTNNDGERSLDGLLQYLLANNDGVFLGEFHSQPFMDSYVLSRLDLLEAAGVTTIYWEMGTEALAAFRADAIEARSRGEQLTPMAEIVLQAEARGMRVLGHDDGRPEGVFDSETPPSNRRATETLDGRDAFSEAFIRANHDGGRYLILGGNSHSRLAGSQEHAPGPGIDTRLGIPSIDFAPFLRFETPPETIDTEKIRHMERVTSLSFPNSTVLRIAQPNGVSIETYTLRGGADGTYLAMHPLDGVFTPKHGLIAPEEAGTNPRTR